MSMASIRSAVPADVDGIVNVHIAAWRTTYPGLMPAEVLAQLSFERRKEWWQRNLEEHPQNVIVAEEVHEIVGFANFGLEHEKDPVFLGELYSLYLLEKHQRKGLGRLLVKAASEGLLGAGINSMLVWVLSRNPACRFYAHLGGIYVREKPLEMQGVNLMESAYGWMDLHSLVASS
jgi:GNAT superfamily N-acetyltransferase